MNSIKAFSGVGIILVALMIFASTMIEPGNDTSSNDFAVVKMIKDSYFCDQYRQESGSPPRLLISCSLDSILVTTNLMHHQFQIHILFDGWEWKIDQIIWQIPKNLAS